MSASLNPHPRWMSVLFALLVAAAVVARFVFLSAPGYGGDELYIVGRSLKMGTGDLNPHHFDWPASLMYDLTFAGYGVLFVIGKVSGWAGSASEFGVRYLADPAVFYLVPRLISGLFGVATAWVMALAVSYRAGRPAAWAAALFLLAAPMHVETSRLAIADGPLTFFIAATLFFSQRIALGIGKPRRNYLLAGVCIGLGTAMKYHGALAAVSVVAAHLYALPDKPWTGQWLKTAAFNSKLWAAGGISLLAFILVTPFAVLDFPGFWHDLTFQFSHQLGGVEHIGSHSAGWRYLLFSLVPFGFGKTLTWLGLAGLVVMIARRRRYAALAVTTLPLLVIYVVVLSRSNVIMHHYVLPLLPAWVAFVAVLVDTVVELWAKSSVGRHGVVTALIAVVTLATLQKPLTQAWETRLQHVDAAVVDWLLLNTQPSDRIALDRQDLTLLPSDAAVQSEIAAAETLGQDGREDYWQTMGRLLKEGGGSLPRRDVCILYEDDAKADYRAMLAAFRPRYFVRSDRVLDRFRRSEGTESADRRLELYEWIEQNARVAATIKPDGTTLRGMNSKLGYTIFEMSDNLE